MSQYHLNFADEPGLSLPQADLHYQRQFLSPAMADKLFATLQRSLQWQQDHIKIAGKQILIPRLQAWYGEIHAAYRYSGMTLTPIMWTPELTYLRQRCADYCQHNFNSVLANLYRDGNDSVSWHADDEPELGEKPLIASLSLGQSRTFELRHNHSGHKHKISLEHGSLLVMKGETQHYWQHRIAKDLGITEPRINLTFRWIK